MKYRNMLLDLLAKNGYSDEQLYDGVHIPIPGKGTIEARLNSVGQTSPGPVERSNLVFSVHPNTSWQDVKDDPSHLTPGDYFISAAIIYEPSGNICGAVQSFQITEDLSTKVKTLQSRMFKETTFDLLELENIQYIKPFCEFFVQQLTPQPVSIGDFQLPYAALGAAVPNRG